MQSFIISYFIRKYGAKIFIQLLIDTYMPGYHLAKNPKRKVSEEVMSTRISL